MSEFVINVTQDAPTVIDVNSTHPTVQLDVVQNQPQSITVEDDANNVLLNPAFFYNGINIVYLTGVSGELLHNTFGDLQGGTTGQYYHLSSGQYFNLATGSVVRPNETGAFINFNSITGDRGSISITGNSPSNLVFTLDDSAVTTSKIQDFAVTSQKIATLSVTNSKLAIGAVSTGNIAFNAVLNSRLADMAHNTIKGRISAGTGDPEDLTADQVKTILNFDSSVSGLLSGYVTGNVVRPNETGSFITNSQTGAFYPRTNPSGFITGVDLSAYVTGSVVRPSETGNFITTSQTGAFYASSNPSGFITGVDLSFSGNYYTKSESESRYVNTTGAETILGDKTFSDKVYINNLYVTGLETIVNTTNTNVASNFIMLNLTGGAVDGGLFFVTGSGLTGVNDSGAIIGFDHSDKFKFGIGTRASDLSVLSTMASFEEVTGISGNLQTQISTLNNQTGSYVLNTQTGNFITTGQTGQFYSSSNPSGYITGVDLSSYVLNSQTGNFITNSQTGEFYPNSNPSGFITGVDLSSYATISYTTGISGVLQTQITDLSNATGSYVLDSETGQFYPTSNPSGFITGLASGDAQNNINSAASFSVSVPTQINNSLNVTGNLTVDTNTLFVDSVNNRVGIGTTSPTAGYALDVNGGLKTAGNILSQGSILYLNSQQALTQGANSLTLGNAAYFTGLNYGNASTSVHNFVTGNIVGNGTGNRLPSQTASSSDSIMTRSMTEEFLLWTPNIMQYFPIAGSTTNGGSVSVTAGQSVQIVAGTQSSGTARTTLVSDWMFSNAAGGSMRYDRPFKVRIPMNCNMNYTDTTGQASCRVYVGSNGSFTLPYAGQEPYPTGTRGVGVEWRKASGSFQQEFRLFARNGTNTTTGQFIATNYTGIGASNSSNSKFYDLLLTFNTDVPTNPILSLYASPWIGLNDTVPSRQSSTPVLTLSGAGVPTGAASLPTNWGRIEAAVVGDGGAIPLQSNTTLNYFRTIYLQQA